LQEEMLFKKLEFRWISEFSEFPFACVVNTPSLALLNILSNINSASIDLSK
jgi:hypothetical protein